MGCAMAICASESNAVGSAVVVVEAGMADHMDLQDGMPHHKLWKLQYQFERKALHACARGDKRASV